MSVLCQIVNNLHPSCLTSFPFTHQPERCHCEMIRRLSGWGRGSNSVQQVKIRLVKLSRQKSEVCDNLLCFSLPTLRLDFTICLFAEQLKSPFHAVGSSGPEARVPSPPSC